MTSAIWRPSVEGAPPATGMAGTAIAVEFLHAAADDIDLDRRGFLVLREGGGGEERGGGEKQGKFHDIPHAGCRSC